MSKVEKFLQSAFFRTLISIVVGFAVGAVFLAAVQINVGAAYGKLFTSIFANAKSLSYSVVYATPLIILGLSVAFSFRTGVFNIGAEGQFVVGSMAACVVGILVPAPAIVLVPLCVLVSAVAGAVWGMIVGILKVKWGINEVLSMIMFTWIAFYLSNYLAGHDPAAQERYQQAGPVQQRQLGHFCGHSAFDLLLCGDRKNHAGLQPEGCGQQPGCR